MSRRLAFDSFKSAEAYHLRDTSGLPAICGRRRDRVATLIEVNDQVAAAFRDQFDLLLKWPSQTFSGDWLSRASRAD